MSKNSSLAIYLRRDLSVAKALGSYLEVTGCEKVDLADVKNSFPFLYGMEGVLNSLWENPEEKHVFESVKLVENPFKVVLSTESGLVKVEFFPIKLENLQKQVDSRNEILRNPFHWSKDDSPSEDLQVVDYFSNFINDVEYFCKKVAEDNQSSEKPLTVPTKDYLFLKELCGVAKDYLDLLPK